MDEDAATFLLSLAHELDDLVETALNVFPNVVLQVQREVLDTLINMIVGGVIRCAVYDVSYAICFKLSKVLGHLVTSEVDEIVEDGRTNTVEHGVFILLP